MGHFARGLLLSQGARGRGESGTVNPSIMLHEVEVEVEVVCE
jgi:hypothetical protein